MKSARSLTKFLLCTLIVSAAAATVLLASKGKKSEPTGVSLVLTGTGRGVDVGFAFGKFTLR